MSPKDLPAAKTALVIPNGDANEVVMRSSDDLDLEANRKSWAKGVMAHGGLGNLCKRVIKRHEFEDNDMQDLFDRYVYPLNVKSLQSAVLLHAGVNIAALALTVARQMWRESVGVSPRPVHAAHIVLGVANAVPLVYQHTQYMKK